MTTYGYHLYRVEFVDKEKLYSCEFYYTAKITPNNDKLVEWGIADDTIKTHIASITDRVKKECTHIQLYSMESKKN